jgi:uncharacterized membrane protein
MDQLINKENENVTGGTTVRKYPVGELEIYEVKESELRELERSSQSDLYLEFAIACISIFFSFLASLLTATFPADTNAEVIFVCIDVIMALSGGLFLLLWLRQRKEKTKVIDAIRKRKK